MAKPKRNAAVNIEQRKRLRARHLLVEAALDMTKLGLKLRRACMLVLVHGYTNAQAAQKIGGLKFGRQNVYRALKKVRPKLAEIERYAKEYAESNGGSHPRS